MKRTVRSAALNITGAHEDPATYSQLIRSAFRLREPIRVRGDQHMIMLTLDSENQEDTTSPMFGTLARYTEIDGNTGWLDLEKMTEADARDKESIKIPENLRPNYSSFFFYFFPVRHKFAFETYGPNGALSVRIASKFMQELLLQDAITEEFGVHAVNIVSEETSVDRLFEMTNLRKVTIHIDRPNPDDLGDVEKKLKDRLKKMNAAAYEETFEAESGHGIVPDEEAKQMAEIATINGEVSVTSKPLRGPQRVASTTEYPRTEQVTYDPDVTSDSQAFRKTAYDVANAQRPENTRDVS